MLVYGVWIPAGDQLPTYEYHALYLSPTEYPTAPYYGILCGYNRGQAKGALCHFYEYGTLQSWNTQSPVIQSGYVFTDAVGGFLKLVMITCM